MALFVTGGSADSGGVSAKNKNKFGVPLAPQMVLILPKDHEDSEYVLNFEIVQRESGFYSEQTDRQNQRTIQYRISI